MKEVNDVTILVGRPLYYRLDGDKPVPAAINDLNEYWQDSERFRRVDKTVLADGVEVSTVFLCINRQFGAGPPILWETMILGGENDEWKMRYSSAQAAREGHAAAVRWLKGEGPEPTERD